MAHRIGDPITPTEALLLDIRSLQAEAVRQLIILNRGVRTMAVDLTSLQAAVEQTTTVEESAVQLINTIAQELGALAGANTVDPADLQALADKLNAESGSLASAVSANTPQAPEPPADDSGVSTTGDGSQVFTDPAGTAPQLDDSGSPVSPS